MLHKFQIEVTTRCNYSCWYCAGRHMDQEDMKWETFTEIVDSIPPGSTVNLQGEGEPFLWEHWWRGVEYLHQRKLIPFVISNGTIVDLELIEKYFPKIAFTIDSLTESEANKNGRHNVKKVKDNVEKLSLLMPNRITIYSVSTGIELDSLVQWAKEINCIHRLKQLEEKDDYVRFYPRGSLPSTSKKVIKPHCSYLFLNTHRFWSVKGTELPCCYIKTGAETFNRSAVAKSFLNGDVPDHCSGCRNIK